MVNERFGRHSLEPSARMSAPTLSETLRKYLSRTAVQKLERMLGGLPPGDRQKLEASLVQQLDSELNTPPVIAVVGKTGVGKTSTINALFGTDLPISHVEPCTKTDQRLELTATQLQGRSGDIVVYDMPGLGEDIEADEYHKQTYARVIAKCDVAVWIMASHDRTLGVDQAMLRDVVAAANSNILEHLVVGLNQVDAIRPGEWRAAPNLPSQEQKVSIEKKVKEIVGKLTRVVPRISSDQIIPYSALRRYRLDDLFAAMLNSCREHRRWVLDSRKSIADFKELLSPELLEKLRDRTYKRGG